MPTGGVEIPTDHWNARDMQGHAHISMQAPTHEDYIPVTCKDMPA